ncbi:hypothetical protein MRB53_038201 [Persea americana]|nr:hypothetical protein MRB53_038201 [Persea americana]
MTEPRPALGGPSAYAAIKQTNRLPPIQQAIYSPPSEQRDGPRTEFWNKWSNASQDAAATSPAHTTHSSVSRPPLYEPRNTSGQRYPSTNKPTR